MEQRFNHIRIVQLIDSLDAGGAERMAVNLSRIIKSQSDFSALMVTRKEGVLKSTIDDNVSYKFLDRKGIIGFSGLLEAKAFLDKNKIDVIHAHSSSLFFAVLIKILRPKTKISWHDHYGKSELLQHRPVYRFKILSYFINGIISVNDQLAMWSKKNLHCKHVHYIPNFFDYSNQSLTQSTLKGSAKINIVCVANFRPIKNHHLLLEVVKSIIQKHPDCAFHLFGKSFEDDYFNEIKQIIENELQENVFTYLSETNLTPFLKQAQIGVLTSDSEGLPLAVLEYGSCHLAVVATQVGDVPKVIEDNQTGFLVPSKNKEAFVEKLRILIENQQLRHQLAENLYQKVNIIHSKEAFMNHYNEFLKDIL